MILISNIISGNVVCSPGNGTCRSAKSAAHLIESREKNRSSRTLIFSTRINLNHPVASYLSTPSCSENIFKPLESNNAILLFENSNRIELRIGYESFFSVKTIEEIKTSNIKKIKFKNETTYVSLPNPIILVTPDITSTHQLSISVIDDDKEENALIDTTPCMSINLTENNTKAIEILNMN